MRFDDFLLRPITRDDAEDLARAADDPDIARQLRDSFPHPYRLRDATNWLASLDLGPPTTVFAFESGGRACGVVGLVRGFDVHAHTAEIGYWVGREHWGKGWTTRAVVAVTGHALGELGLHRVFAHVFSSNPGSRRVLEKAGYLLEGTLRRSVFKAGQELDQWLFAALAGEWTPPDEWVPPDLNSGA